MNRQPINAADSELALIAAAMLDREAINDACERLRPEHFSDPLYARMWDFIRKSGAVDPVLLHNAFSADPALEELGGVRFLAELFDTANTYAIEGHASAVMDAALRRELQLMARQLDTAASAKIGEGEALLAELERNAAEIARRGAQKPRGTIAGITAAEMLDAAYDGRFAGTTLGLQTLDRVTGGIRQDDVWFIGGRTSMGKSVVGVTLARLLAQQGRGVFFFSLEMPLREVQARLIADAAFDRWGPYDGRENVRYGDILKGRGSGQQRDRARAAAKAIASLPLMVNDQGGLTIEDIRSQALRQIRGWERNGVKPGALIIDHIGLVKPHTRRGDSKAAETADTVNELKHLAKQVGAPVIALVQVNRATESRNDKRPTLADLNWSGAIEQIADLICLLYREAYYLERSASREDQNRVGEVEHDLELIIAKNRSGPICGLKVYADVACNAVRDMEEEQARAYR